MNQKWKVEKNGDVTIGDFTFAGPFTEIHGTYNTHILGNVLPILIASKDESLLLDPANPRIDDAAAAKVKGNLTGAGQKRLKEYLTGEAVDGAESKSLKLASDRLKASIELHGGQNESLWVHNNIVVEGNRRRAILNGALVCLVYPDQATQEQIFAIVTQRHTAGPMEWASFVMAKTAHQALTEFKWDMKRIVSHFQFNSEKDAAKYIHSYVWLEASGLGDIQQWSKFHHAYVPTLVNHFGYNPATMQFEPLNRKKANENSAEPADVDKIAGTKTDFEWFVNLIKHGKVTDCRHSDGIVAPAIREAEEEYGPKVLELLQRSPEQVQIQKVGGGKSKKKAKAAPPAEQAWAYLKECHAGNHLIKKVTALKEDLEFVLAKASRLADYKEDTGNNLLLRVALQSLEAQVKKMAEVTASEKQKEKKAG